MYFILTANTEMTVATTDFEDVANFIAENFPAKCIIRYVAKSNSAYQQSANFFSTKEEIKKGA